MEQVYKAFGPDNFKTVSEDEATIFTCHRGKIDSRELQTFNAP